MGLAGAKGPITLCLLNKQLMHYGKKNGQKSEKVL